MNIPPGTKYLSRSRSNKSTPIVDVFSEINNRMGKASQSNMDLMNDPEYAKANLPFAGELLLGHLRYGTFGKNDYINDSIEEK